MAKKETFQQEVAGLLIDISLFINKVNPNPLAAISAIEILKSDIANKYIFEIEIADPYVKIINKEVKVLYDELWAFFNELDLYDHPDTVIAVLEITKNQFIKEIERIGEMRRR